MRNESKTRTLSFRLAEDDYETLVKRCREAELSQSKYLRYLIRIPLTTDGGATEDASCIVLDKMTMRKMSKELTRWGYHYNQAVHALNSINYYITNGKVKEDLLDGKAESIELALIDVNENAQRIVCELASLQDNMVVEDR